MLQPKEVEQLLDEMSQECGCPIGVSDRLSAYANGLAAATKFLAERVSLDKATES